MSVPFSSAGSAPAKRTTTDVVVELSHPNAAPTLPYELRDHVLPNTWASRVSELVLLGSQYCRPTFERAYLLFILMLALLVPITTYYVILAALERSKTLDSLDEEVWLARLSAIAAAFGAWIILSVPILVWKYLGKVRVAKLAAQWSKADLASASSYDAPLVWKASGPGLFRDSILLTVTVPVAKRSNFDRNSSLPSYIAAADDPSPPYLDPNMVDLSKDLEGGVKYGELPIYSD